MTDIDKNILNVFKVSKYDRFDKYRLIAKTNEEWGELCEVILIEDGELPDKVATEDSFHEAADTIQCILAVLTKHHPDLTPEELTQRLSKALENKTNKYKKKLNDYPTN